MPHTVLVVDPDVHANLTLSRTLADAGYVVTGASSFAQGRRHLALTRPDVLITAVRLGGYNGLHLVIGSRFVSPDTVAIVTHSVADPVLQADAAGQRALYLVTPVDPKGLVDTLAQLLASRPPQSWTTPRRWLRKRVAPVDVALDAVPARILDVSYGGARLQLTREVDRTQAVPHQLAFPTARVAVGARPVWSRSAGPDGPWWCGVEVHDSDPTAERAWRGFVDGLG